MGVIFERWFRTQFVSDLRVFGVSLTTLISSAKKLSYWCVFVLTQEASITFTNLPCCSFLILLYWRTWFSLGFWTCRISSQCKTLSFWNAFGVLNSGTKAPTMADVNVVLHTEGRVLWIAPVNNDEENCKHTNQDLNKTCELLSCNIRVWNRVDWLYTLMDDVHDANIPSVLRPRVNSHARNKRSKHSLAMT